MKKTATALAIAAVATLGWTAPALADDGLTATTGVDYSKGDYGTGVDTEILIVPFSLRYKSGDLRFSATIPWLRIDGSSAIVGDGSGGVVIDPNAPRTVRSGFGDVNLGVAYTIPEERGGDQAVLSLGQISRFLLSSLPRLTLRVDDRDSWLAGVARKVGYTPGKNCRLVVRE